MPPPDAFTYLLVNHVPLMPGSRPNTVRLGDLWLEDLTAQARAIAQEGGRLVVATPFGGSSQAGSFGTTEVALEQLPFRYEPLPYFRDMGSFARAYRPLCARLEALLADADVAHVALGGHPIPPGAVAWRIATRIGVPRIVVFDGSDEVERRWDAVRAGSPAKRPLRWAFAWLFERFARRAVASASLAWSHNASIPRRFSSHWDARCHVFPRSFVTNDLVIPEEAVAARIRRIRDDDPLVAATVGRQVPMKATDHVLRALRIARDRGARVRLLVIGDGESLAAYKQLAVELGVGDDVEFTGAVPYGDSLFALWDRAHLTVITNLTAEISRNVLLSMARGTPLLMYANPGTDALLPATAASLVPRGDVDALAGKLVAAWRDRTELMRQAEIGHQFATSTTLEACHRARARLAANLVARSTVPRSTTSGE